MLGFPDDVFNLNSDRAGGPFVPLEFSLFDPWLWFLNILRLSTGTMVEEGFLLFFGDRVR